MTPKFLSGPGLTVGLVGLLVAGLSLVACGGGETASEQAVTPTEVVAEATQAPAEAATPTEVAQTNPDQGSSPQEPLASTASCQPVDIPENPAISAVSEEDWVKGPADALVTLIEYGDFQ